jgi:single-stranded-DNA-specific exonuclease
MERQWKLKPEGDRSVADILAKQLQIPRVFASLLVQRGICSLSEAERFFAPCSSQLHPPKTMAGINKAVDRIATAVKRHEKILVFGDYDVDGITAVAMVYSFLKTMTESVDFYIPDRYTEGYGVSSKGIDYAVEHGISLIITLDCGIKAVEKIRRGRELGLEFIICDHHYPGQTLPDAVAILNPKRLDCDYPFKHLSGCGVGFKLIQAYAQAHGMPSEQVDCYLDMVAVSIASDVVPMVGENRVLATLGLSKLNKNPGLGMKCIIKTSNLKEKSIRIEDIIFKIGPRINAAGRMERGSQAVRLLVSNSEYEAMKIARDVEENNQKRKTVDSSITQQALRMLSNDHDTPHRCSTVLFNEQWHKGVVGIVASRIIETYYRPTVVLTQSNDLATGSARSVDGFDLYKAIEECSDLLEDYGGHMFAAGVSMKVDKVAAFREKFEEVVSASIMEDQKRPHIEVDAELALSEISPDFFAVLQKFQPFGPENLQPVFVTRGVRFAGPVSVVGKTGEHLKLEVFHPSQPRIVCPAIGFQLGDRIAHLKGDGPFDICYVVEENVFKGVSTLQLNIRDIRPSRV